MINYEVENKLSLWSFKAYKLTSDKHMILISFILRDKQRRSQNFKIKEIN